MTDIVAIFREDLSKIYYVIHTDLSIDKRQRLDTEMRIFLATEAEYTKVWRGYTICTTSSKMFMLVRDYIMTVKEFNYEQKQNA